MELAGASAANPVKYHEGKAAYISESGLITPILFALAMSQ